MSEVVNDNMVSIPSIRTVRRTTMYMDTTLPLDEAGAISLRKSGATTVSPPAPRPPHMREKSSRPVTPEEKVVMRNPVIHQAMKSCQVRRRPRRSVRARAKTAPMAAPRTPKEEMLALRSARAEALPCHWSSVRPKSWRKEGRPLAPAKPPSS